MIYVLDDKNNKVEGLDKQGVLAVLEQAIENGSLESIASDSAFVDKLKCCVNGATYKVAFITQAKYNELKAEGELITNCYYFITDDTTCEDIDEQLANLTEAVNALIPKVSALETKMARTEKTAIIRTKNKISGDLSGEIKIDYGENIELEENSTYIFDLPDASKTHHTFILHIGAIYDPSFPIVDFRSSSSYKFYANDTNDSVQAYYAELVVAWFPTLAENQYNISLQIYGDNSSNGFNGTATYFKI